ncbi:MAG: 7-cyano-7-deazaguanine synthase [Acidobacteriota bacterium]
MVQFALRLTAPETVTAAEAASSFYWLLDSRSSFTPGLGPSLGAFGAVPSLNIDLVRIALAVYAADRSVPRTAGGSDWNQREIELQIPVSDAAPWRRVASELEAAINFLSGDRWRLSFHEEEAPTEDVRQHPETPRRVVLLSGGADSAVGGLVSRSALKAGDHQHLLSHFSASHLAPTQRRVAAELERLIPGPSQRHEVVHLSRKGRRIDGNAYPDEFSTRSRSLLFLSLGLAAAAVHGVPLWIPENGFASLNPPLGPERRGSLSTRTTHPMFLQSLTAVLNQIGAHAQVENPFARSTKGEIFAQAANLVGAAEASALLSGTHSCSLTGQRAHGVPPSKSCGVCFACLVRRASFVASGLDDQTEYIDADDNTALAEWLTTNSVERQVQNFIQRGVQPRDLIALNLPADYPISEALDLCRRAIVELRSLYP